LEVLGEVNWHTGEITGFLFSQFDDIITSCARDGTILSYKVATGQKREIYRGESNKIKKLNFWI
jgi:WD40 repeat protein